MRKILFALMLLPAALFAQTGNDVVKLHNYGLIGIQDNTPVQVPISQSAAKTSLNPDFFILAPPDTFTMGLSVYDLQTNASVARRIVLYPDGEITAVWTTSTSLTDQNFTVRGTGYNHYNSKTSSWLLPEGQLAQPVETNNYHSGWPNPCIDSVANPAHEFCISHSPGDIIPGVTTSTLQRIDNVVVGGNSWTQTTISNNKTNSPLWPRVAQSGNYAYMIANYDDQQDTSHPVEIKGIKNPTVYYRSVDGGTTWASDSTLPGYDTSGNIALPGGDKNEVYGNGDNYAIDAQDSNVAIVIGGYFDDLSLWKSNDYGKTFTKTIIDTSMHRFNHSGPGFTVTPNHTVYHYANDGSMSVILDKNDNAHVFYGVRALKDTGGIHQDSLYIHNDGYNGILHWDEKNAQKTIIGYSPDLNGNNTLDVGHGYFENTSGGISFEYGTDGLTSMPTSTIDANGNIYCIYSVYMESPDSTAATPAEIDQNSWTEGYINDWLHYRDLFITYSKDGGKTWAAEQNISKSPFIEEVYPSLARNTDGQLHLEFMSDSFAGDYVEHVTEPTITTKQKLIDFSNIKYMGINISDVLNGNFGAPSTYEGIKPYTQQNAVFAVSDIYPNPTNNGNVNVAITMQTPANASIDIYDMAGHLISEQDLGLLPSGKQVETINSKALNSGMYFVKVNAGGYTTVNKLVID